MADSKAATEKAIAKEEKLKARKLDPNLSTLRLFGPLNTASFIETTRYYINREHFTFDVVEFIDSTPWTENELKVTPIVLSLEAGDLELEEDSTSVPSSEGLRVSSQFVSPEPNRYSLKLCAVKGGGHEEIYDSDSRPHFRNLHPRKYKSQTDITLCYLLELPPIPGKFDANKARTLGVKPGPEFGKLSKGLSITLENGKTVHPSDVIAPSEFGQHILVIHCPTIGHLKKLVSSPHIIKSTDEPLLSFIFHITPREVLHSSEYQQFIGSFKGKIEHIVMNADCSQNVIFSNWCRNQSMFHSLHPQIFPLPFHTPASVVPLQKGMHYAESLQVVHMVPTSIAGFERGTALPPFCFDVLSSKPLLKEKIETFRSAISSVKTQTKADDVEIVFLGTGAALPSKYRNVTGHFINIPNHGTMLLDAGEGSFGQLYRRYGPEMTDTHLKNLKLVFISHIHADHHLGLVRILTRRQKLFQGKETANPIYVVAPTWVFNWLQEYSSIERLDFIYVNCQHIQEANHQFGELFSSLLGISELRAVLVDHCPDAFGSAVTHQDGWKIVFSGDTRPCLRLASVGRDATILIHEATFEDEKGEDAVKKAHATTSEAIKIGKEMNAKFIMLNHFSQRYPKMPTFSKESSAEDISRASIAFDLMSIKLGDIPILASLYEPLKSICDEIEKEEDDLDKDEAKPEVKPKKVGKK